MPPLDRAQVRHASTSCGAHTYRSMPREAFNLDVEASPVLWGGGEGAGGCVARRNRSQACLGGRARAFFGPCAVPGGAYRVKGKKDATRSGVRAARCPGRSPRPHRRAWPLEASSFGRPTGRACRRMNHTRGRTLLHRAQTAALSRHRRQRLHRDQIAGHRRPTRGHRRAKARFVFSRAGAADGRLDSAPQPPLFCDHSLPIP